MTQTEKKYPFIGIGRLRMEIDGDGVTTLCCFHGCPLRCKYCINPHSFSENAKLIYHSPQSLYDEVKRDQLYFLATGGGIMFGGGEPLLYPEFLREFRTLCGGDWHLYAETSLNVPAENVIAASEVIDKFHIDIKDMNPEIYRSYTGKDNARVYENLRILLDLAGSEKIHIRLPLIRDYNTDADRDSSEKFLREMGITEFERFDYVIRK